MTEKFVLKNGKKLLLRPMQASDYLLVQEYLEQLASETIFTNQYVGRARKSKEDFEKAITKQWQIVALDGEKIAGFVSAGSDFNHLWKNRVCSFGVHMLQAYYRNGLRNYFMNLLEQWAKENNMHRIEGEVRVSNTSGIELYKKHGFEIEGCKKDCAYINSVWHSDYIIGKILNNH